MSVTVKDIAKEAGVSPPTVSKALNNRPGVSLPVKRRIEAIAERLGYAPYIGARRSGMYASSTSRIAVIYAYAGGHLVSAIQNGIDGVLYTSKFYEVRYTVNVGADLYDDERRNEFFDSIMEDKSIAGVLSVFLLVPDAVIGRFQDHGIPVVLLNQESDCGKCVLTDNVEACRAATRTLLDLGRRRIGLIMPEETKEAVWDRRLKGYKKAMAEAGIAYDPRLLVYEHNFSLKDAALATKALLERDPTIDAILYGSDLQAYGGMQALKEMGKRIPEDVAVMGFDDMPFSRISNPPLSSVRQPMDQMGTVAAKLLLKAIKEKDFSHETRLLASEVIVRGSTHKEVPAETFLP